ncbi:MAG: AsmA family protein [Gammaproteobacteria bacterium]|nr:AsmA family protein [Gammaproteobacteria bacterium]
MKPVRIVVFALIAIVVVVLAVPVIVLSVIDGDDVKDFVANRVFEQTGRKLEFTGPVEVGFWPKLSLKTGAVNFTNAPGFGDEPMFAVREFQIALATAPLLLRRDIVLDAVRLHGLRLNLVRNATGAANWDGLASSEGEPLQLGGITLGGIDIQDAAISYTDATPDAPQQVTIRDLAAATDAFVVGEPIALRLSLNGTATRPALDGGAELRGTLQYELNAQHYRIDDLVLETTLRGNNLPGGAAVISARAAVEGDLKAGTTQLRNLALSGLGSELSGQIELAGAAGTRGELRASGQDLALLFRVAELAAAAQLRQARDRSFTLATRFDVNPDKGTASVPEFTLDLLGANLRGELNARNLDRDQPAVTGSITASGPDLPAVLAVLGQFQSTKEKPLLRMAESLGAVRDKAFTAVTQFNADLGSGQVELSQLELSGLGYGVTGNFKADDINRASGAIAGKLALRGEPAGPLLGAVANPGLGESVRTLAIDAELHGTTGELNVAPLAIKATVAGPGDGAPLDLAVTAGAATANLERGDLTVTELGITGLGIDGNGKLHATGLRAEPKFDGAIELKPFNLREVLRRLRQELPEMADAKALSQVALRGNFAGSAGEFALNDIVLGLDDASIRGKLAARGGDRPGLEFAFEADRLDADRYLPPQPQGKGKAAPAPEAAAAAAAELPVETLRALNASGDLKIAALRLSGLQLSNVHLALAAAGGTIKLDPIAASLYRGSYLGRITLNATGAVPRLEFQTELKGVDISPLLADLNNKSSGQVAGTAEFAAALTGSGADSALLKQSLAGPGTFMIRDGVYHGIDIPAVLRQTELMIRSKSFSMIRKDGDTPFEQLGGSIQVTGGVMRSDDFVLLTPGIRVQGNGVLYDLNTGAVDYRLELGVDPATATRNEQRYDLGGYGIPVACRAAPPKSPEVSCLPDVSKIAQAVGTSVITDQVQRLLQGGKKDQATETPPAEQQQQQPQSGKELLRRGLENLLNR